MVKYALKIGSKYFHLKLLTQSDSFEASQNVVGIAAEICVDQVLNVETALEKEMIE